MELANLVSKKNVRKHVIIKRILTVPEKPDQLWQQDIIYIWCGGDGWYYLFSILDCFNREWLAYTFSTFCGTDEVIRTMEMAILERFPDKITSLSSGLVTIRSDGGSQYTSDRFVSTLKVYGIRQEITGKNRLIRMHISKHFTSPSRKTVSGSMTLRHSKKPRLSSASSFMTTTRTYLIHH